MSHSACSLFIIAQTVLSVQCFFHNFPKIEHAESDGGDPGTPLFLTPYIESGNISEARRLARVPVTEDLHIESYAGFFTVNKTYNSNQFFWYFPAIMPKTEKAPVVVWLQGGPGGSSMFGLLVEHGPIQIRKGQFEKRQYNWALSHHIIYIDNPVGTGFSFTENPAGYCTNEVQIGEQLYSTLIQFFQLFPELQHNKFFVSGESYAGKYVPALAYAIHKKNADTHIKINLRGVAIGNGLSDPIHQLDYDKYLYQIGLIDSNGAQLLEELKIKVINHIKNNQYTEAFNVFDMLVNEFSDLSGFDLIYNYLHTKDYLDNEIVKVLQKSSVRRALHVGNVTFDFQSADVYGYLEADFLKSVAPWISELLDHYSVLVYNGQLDIIVAYPLTVNYLKNLNFTGSGEYVTAKRHKWMVDGDVAGYVKRAGRLTEVLVRDAGHMVPSDQPKWALDLITTFTHDMSFIDGRESN